MEKRPVSAIICEFDPLHSGHERLLRYASMEGSTPVVCILSGNFVQRGEAAMYDKWTRTEAALRCGADLVVELPLPWAMSGAENFARGGVSLAAAAGCTHLFFGSECGNISTLQNAAGYLAGGAFPKDLHNAPEQEQTLPFARRRELVLARALGETTACAVREPNNTLATEYCKAIYSLRLPLQPVTLRREGAGHNDAVAGETASASALRQMIRQGNFAAAAAYMPAPAARIFAGQPIAQTEYLERAVLYALRTASAEKIASTPDTGEGIENRILEAAGRASSLEELYMLVKSKRYSHARIRRLVLSFFLGVRHLPTPLPPYLRVLGMTGTGAGLLKNAALPVVTRASQVHAMGEEQQALFRLESAADDIHALAYTQARPAGSNTRHGIVVL